MGMVNGILGRASSTPLYIQEEIFKTLLLSHRPHVAKEMVTHGSVYENGMCFSYNSEPDYNSSENIIIKYNPSSGRKRPVSKTLQEDTVQINQALLLN